jgi:hypothetical protein
MYQRIKQREKYVLEIPKEFKGLRAALERIWDQT